MLLLSLLLPVAMAEPLTIDDYFSLDSASVKDVSSDGNRALLGVGRWNEDTDRQQWDLWEVQLRSGQLQRLTFDRQSEWSATYGADGAIWFLGTDDQGDDDAPTDGSRQVFRYLDGVAAPVTAVHDGVSSFQLSQDGSALFVSRDVDHRVDDAFADLRKTHADDIAYGHGVQNIGAIDRYDTTTWRRSSVYSGERVVVEFSLSPDANTLALVTTPDEELIHKEGWSHVELVDVATGTVERLDDALWRAEAPSPYGWLYGLTWSYDGVLAHRVDFDGHPGEQFVTTLSPTRTRRVARSSDVTLSGSPVFRPGTRELCGRVDFQGRRPLQCTAPDGSVQGWAGADDTVGSFVFGPKGRTVTAIVTTPEQLATVQSGRAGRLREVVAVNPHASDWEWPTVSDASWAAPDGTEVHGVLELPRDWTPEQGPLALVVSIHGGPTSATQRSRRLHMDGRGILASQGYALLSPNYRGSTGFGDDFLLDLVGHECDVEVADILAGVDSLVEQGIADPDRLAVMGWSNGGFLTNCLITQTDRFKAASSGAGVFDQGMQWATEDTPGHVINYMEGLPWEQPEAYAKASPMLRAGGITTPTLIHIGENDERVPLVHAQALYRALFQYLDIPTELVVYEGTGHGLRTLSHRRAKFEWDAAWFEHFVTVEYSAARKR
jgi:dipeptidyl aminopeptidase/acylaminoacyl peptidase